MDQAHVFTAILVAIAIAIWLQVLLLFELRWHGRLLGRMRTTLRKLHQGARPTSAPARERATPADLTLPASRIADPSGDEWDRRFVRRLQERLLEDELAAQEQQEQEEHPDRTEVGKRR
jgi:hypothetical protein